MILLAFSKEYQVLQTLKAYLLNSGN